MTPRIFITMCLLVVSFTGFSQVKNGEKKSNKVEIFTSEEKDNLQMWFHKEIQRMNFTDDEKEEYIHILTYYLYKIYRLDDEDQFETMQKLKVRLNEYLAKQDAELVEILTAEQFQIHKEVYGQFLDSAYERWGLLEK